MPRRDDLRTIDGADLVVVQATVEYASRSDTGKTRQAMHNRLTWALRRGADGRWRIAHEHTSAPADFETGTVRLSR